VKLDNFGIGAAILGAAEIYFRAARQTGRTTNLVESLKDGDRVVFDTYAKAKWFINNRLKGLGIDVECIAIPPEYPGKIFERGTSQGRTIFDHDWVEAFYLLRIKDLIKELDHLERESSGYGEAHRETLRAAEEVKRWLR
jgi:hypothetical protein